MAIAAAEDLDTIFDMRNPSLQLTPYDCRARPEGTPQITVKAAAEGAAECRMQNAECRVQNVEFDDP
jgi:hypothetical protein